MRPPHGGVRHGVFGVELHRSREHLSRLGIRLLRGAPVILQAAQDIVIGLDVPGGRSPEAVFLRSGELHREDPDDLLRDLVLQGEDVLQIPVITLRPHVVPRGGVDELGGDPHAIAGLANAALQDVAHAQLAAHLRGLDRPALVREDGVARDHEQPGELGEARDEVFGDPVAEVLLPRVAAHVFEGQHGDGGPVGQLERGGAPTRVEAPDRRATRGDEQHEAQEQRGPAPREPPDDPRDSRARAGGFRLAEDPVDSDRLPDVLDAVLAAGLVRERQLLLDLIVDSPGDRDAARLGKAFDARRDVHAVPVDPLALHDHVAEVDADAKLQPARRR